MNIILYILKKYKFNSQTCRLLAMSAMLILFSTGTSVAQYSYFNEIYLHSENSIEKTRSIELWENGFTNVSKTTHDNHQSLVFRKYDFEGNLLIEKFHDYPNKIINLGWTDGFVKDHHSTGYYMTFTVAHYSETVDFSVGVLIYLDSELNLVWEEKYYLYDDRSMVLEHLIIEDNQIILLGILNDGQSDQIVIKTDLAGNMMSHFVLEFESLYSDRSFDIDYVGNDLLLSGSRHEGEEHSLLTKIDRNGNLIWQTLIDESQQNEYGVAAEIIDEENIISVRVVDTIESNTNTSNSKIQKFNLLKSILILVNMNY